MLAYLDVAHDVPVAPELQTAGKINHAVPSEPAGDENRARYEAAVDKNESRTAAPTMAFDDQQTVIVPNLAGQTVRSVTEACSRLGLVPSLIGSGVALEQSVEGGEQVLRGTRLTVRFGRAGALVPASTKGAEN